MQNNTEFRYKYNCNKSYMFTLLYTFIHIPYIPSAIKYFANSYELIYRFLQISPPRGGSFPRYFIKKIFQIFQNQRDCSNIYEFFQNIYAAI